MKNVYCGRLSAEGIDLVFRVRGPVVAIVAIVLTCSGLFGCDHATNPSESDQTSSQKSREDPGRECASDEAGEKHVACDKSSSYDAGDANGECRDARENDSLQRESGNHFLAESSTSAGRESAGLKELEKIRAFEGPYDMPLPESRFSCWDRLGWQNKLGFDAYYVEVPSDMQIDTCQVFAANRLLNWVDRHDHRDSDELPTRWALWRFLMLELGSRAPRIDVERIERLVSACLYPCQKVLISTWLGRCLTPDGTDGGDDFVESLRQLSDEPIHHKNRLLFWATAAYKISRFQAKKFREMRVYDYEKNSLSIGDHRYRGPPTGWRSRVDVAELARALLGFEAQDMHRAAHIYVDAISDFCGENLYEHGNVFRALGALPPELWRPDDEVAEDFFSILTGTWMLLDAPAREDVFERIRQLVLGLSELERKTVLWTLRKGAEGRGGRGSRLPGSGEELQKTLLLMEAIPQEGRLAFAWSVSGRRVRMTAEQLAIEVERALDPDRASDYEARWTDDPASAWDELQISGTLPSAAERARRARLDIVPR